MRKVLIPKSHTILELFSLIVFTQFCNSIFIIRINLAAKLQIKIERTKKKGEKLASCSLDIVKILQLIIHHLVYSKNITNFAEKLNMPTLLIIFGMRFFFYLDEHLPIHVHIERNGKKAKIDLCPDVRLVYNHGMKEQEIKKAIEICIMYKDEFIKEWHRRFD